MCMWKRVSLSLVLAGIFGIGAIFAQSSIVILDKSTGNSLPNAHVCFESLDKESSSYCLSGKDGSLVNNIEKRSLISVSSCPWIESTSNDGRSGRHAN